MECRGTRKMPLAGAADGARALAPVGKIRKRAPGSPTKGQRRADSAELGWPAERALLGPLSRPGTLSLRTNDGVEQEHP